MQITIHTNTPHVCVDYFLEDENHINIPAFKVSNSLFYFTSIQIPRETLQCICFGLDLCTHISTHTIWTGYSPSIQVLLLEVRILQTQPGCPRGMRPLHGPPVISHHDPVTLGGQCSLIGSELPVSLIGYLARQMTFNWFGRVVIGSLWESTAHTLNKEYQGEENNEGENNNYVDGVTLKGTSLIPQTGERMCLGRTEGKIN